MVKIETLDDAKAVIFHCLKYLRRQERMQGGADSLDITLVLGQLKLIGDTEEIPGLRERLKHHQWLRVAHKLEEVLSQLIQIRKDIPADAYPEIDTVFHGTTTLLQSLIDYCTHLSIEQRRIRGRDSTRRYRKRRQAT